MHGINEFGFSILGQYMTIHGEFVFFTDFDHFDRNLTTLRKISRDMTSKYFDYSPRQDNLITFCMQYGETGVQVLERFFTRVKQNTLRRCSGLSKKLQMFSLKKHGMRVV